MDEQIKQVRVDNWGIFFLQRLQLFFNKTDYCDLTLQFEGNVQLKVHRLVVNACTEYFQVLEQTCEMMAEDIMVMPPDLQADVVLPIVNFMYTGMLEFHIGIYDKLYKTACLMNITVLTKLLDAQRASKSSKKSTQPVCWTIPEKTFVPKIEPDLSSTFTDKKLPAWKRKSSAVANQNISRMFTEEKRQAISIDPLSFSDNTPKPTRFDWPDEDLPQYNIFDTDFNEISYSSTPIFIKVEEPQYNNSLDCAMNDEGEDSEILGCDGNVSTREISKRKLESETVPVKRVRFNTSEKENKSKLPTKISIIPSGKCSTLDIDHTKIITEVLKKCPSFIKKKQKVRLKILAKNNSSPVTIKNIPPVKSLSPEVDTLVEDKEEKGPWQCKQCSTPQEPCEFVLYYLYRKHMTDSHFEKFDSRMCKFCGHKSTKHNLLMYHQYIKHGVKPPIAYDFPKCDQCPFIALNDGYLNKHKAKHSNNELQCVNCNVTFTTEQALLSHMKITGHTGKQSKPTYDCQYCITQCQSSNLLFAHLKQQHRDEARRDGIVSIDEIVDEEEYVLPEHISDIKRDKVKILSDVKLPTTIDTPQQAVSLEPSSEAEALNNVASGIATSLGLVDVVVLDDNQQYILHADNQQDMSRGSSEFILPDIQDSQDFAPTHDEVASSESNLAMLHNTDITSTDELVMVLTDQDYNSEHNEMLDGDHSNIVVLYSHPVECPENQFMPSGNIVLSSESGIIELQNTNTFVPSNIPSFMTTTPSQMPASNEIESIELIQREIDGDCKGSDIPVTNDVNVQIVALSEDNATSTGSVNHQDIIKPNYISENIPSAFQAPPLEENLITNLQETINIDPTIVNSTVINSDDNAVSEPNIIVSEMSNIPSTDVSNIMVESHNDIEMEAKSFEEIPSNAISEHVGESSLELQPIVEQEVEQPEESGSKIDQHIVDAVSADTATESNIIQQPLELQHSDSVLEYQEIAVNSEGDSSQPQQNNLATSAPLEPPDQPLAVNSQPTEQVLNSQVIENNIDPDPCTSQSIMPQATEELLVTEVALGDAESNTIDSQNTSCQPQNGNEEINNSSSISKKAGVKSAINKKTAKTILDDWDETDSPRSASNVHKIIDDWDDEDDDTKRCE